MIKFLYNINKDAQNWVETVKSTEPSWGINYGEETKMVPKSLKNQILKTDEKKAIKLVKNYLENQSYFKLKRKIIISEARAIEKVWRTKEKEYFKILENLTKKPLFSSTITSYFTTMFICPYDEEKYKWFMLSMWHSLPFQLTTICHEIFHFQFLYYYTDFCRKQGLDKSQIKDIKEALTVLLNAKEFDNIVLSQDGGYPHHQALRKKILNTWQNNRSLYLKDKNGFEIFLKKIITCCF